MIKAVYTYYDNPADPKWSGFRNKDELVNSIRLSVMYSRRQFKEVQLVTNSFGAKVLQDIFFDDISLELNSYNMECRQVWSIAKLIAFSIQTNPFIHIDNDVYLVEPIKQSLLTRDYLFQNKESLDTHKHYEEIHKKIDIPFSKSIVKLPEFAVNCGIVYARRNDIFKTALSIGLRIVKEGYSNLGWINHYVEQFVIACLIKPNSSSFIIDPFDNKSVSITKGYVHLWGDTKRQQKYVDKVKELLERNLPKGEDKVLKEATEINESSLCKHALVISLPRNYENRLQRLQKGFTFNMSLNLIAGIDGLENKPPVYCKLKAGTYGCLQSHIKALKFARDNNYDSVLILEDDVHFVQNFEYMLNMAMSELPQDWDLLWLGGSDHINPEPYSARLNKLISSWGAYGYIVRNTAYDFFIDILSCGTRPSDDYYQMYQRYFNSYRTKNPLVVHHMSQSVRETTDKLTSV